MARSRALELALDYRCNLRCLGCKACDGSGESMRPDRALAIARDAFAKGARTLWLGGGEPTLREDLLALVGAARKLGYEDVVVQTNGLRLAYPAYAKALVDAGVTEVRTNVKSSDAALHDRLSRREGAHALLLRALDNLAPLAVSVVADVLLVRASAPGLAGTVAFFADRGVRSFALWLLFAGDVADEAVDAEVPRIVDLVDALRTARELARSRALSLVSYHTPPCTLPPDLRSLWQPAATLDLTVVDPGGHAFALERSPFEGAGHAAPCAGCVVRDHCGGPRADYLRLHGADEFHALSSFEA